MAAVVRRLRPAARIAYVMTDGAALPPRPVRPGAPCGTGGVLDVTVTAGHAFGGDLRRWPSPRPWRWPTTSPGPTWWWWGWGPGWWAPPHRSAPPRSRWRGSSTPPTPSAPGWRCAPVRRAPTRGPPPGVSHHVRTILGLAAVRPEVPCRPTWRPGGGGRHGGRRTRRRRGPGRLRPGRDHHGPGAGRRSGVLRRGRRGRVRGRPPPCTRRRAPTSSLGPCPRPSWNACST